MKYIKNRTTRLRTFEQDWTWPMALRRRALWFVAALWAWPMWADSADHRPSTAVAAAGQPSSVGRVAAAAGRATSARDCSHEKRPDRWKIQNKIKYKLRDRAFTLFLASLTAVGHVDCAAEGTSSCCCCCCCGAANPVRHRWRCHFVPHCRPRPSGAAGRSWNCVVAVAVWVRSPGSGTPAAPCRCRSSRDPAIANRRSDLKKKTNNFNSML